MKKIKIFDISINVLGAVVVFAVFSAEPFIEMLIDGSFFLLPWWGWGIVGALIFEVIYCIVFFKGRVCKKKK